MTSQTFFTAAAADLWSLCQIFNLDRNVLTPETRTALLVLQAAGDAHILADKAEILAKNYVEAIKNREPVNISEFLYVPHTNPLFKHVGAPGQSGLLQRAQALWMGAQMVLNNEINAVNDHIDLPGFIAAASSVGVEGAQAFKQAAITLYADVAAVLRANGHEAAASKLETLHQTLAIDTRSLPTPADVMHQLANACRKDRADMLVVLDEQLSLTPDSRLAAYKKVQTLLHTPVTVAAQPPALQTAGPAYQPH